MNVNPFELKCEDIAWCPGCGNFSILKTLKEALAELNLLPGNVVMVSGIGTWPSKELPKAKNFLVVSSSSMIPARRSKKTWGYTPKTTNPSLKERLTFPAFRSW